MKITPRWAVLVVLVLAAGFMMAQAQRTQVFPQQTRVAVVDVNTVFERAKQAEAMQAQQQQDRDRFLQRRNEQEREIRELEEQLEHMVDRNAPAHQEMLDRYTLLAITLQAEMEFQGQRLSRQRARQLREVYQGMLESIDRVATANDVDLVLFDEPSVDMDSRDPSTVTTRINLRKVLWARQSIDLTQQVIQDMDLRYDQR